MCHTSFAGRVLLLAAAAGCAACFESSADPFVVELTVDRGAIEVPARLDLEIVELDAPGGATLSTRTESQNGPDFFATAQSSRLILSPASEAGAVRLRATAFDAGGSVIATGALEVPAQPRTVEATLYLIRGDGADAGSPDGG